LGIENHQQIMSHPLLGGLFENLVVMEFAKSRLNIGRDPKMFFFRDNNRNEVDLILDHHEGPIPVEIKAAMTFNEKLVKGVAYFQKIYSKAGKGQLVYSGTLSLESKNYNVINFKDVGELTW
jgi:predicted AAA+ superfamily ATPase